MIWVESRETRMTDGAFTTDDRADDILDVVDSLERSSAKFGVYSSSAENTKVAFVDDSAKRFDFILLHWDWQTV